VTAVDERVGWAVESFVAALGALAEPEVVGLAHGLAGPIAFADLGVLVQGHRRDGLRSRPVLVALLGGELTLAGADADPACWPAAASTATARPGRLAGQTVQLEAGGERMSIQRAMPVDEVGRLVAMLSGHGGDIPSHPPLARLGPAALYQDQIVVDGGGAAPLELIHARTIELPATGPSLRRLLGDDPGPPRAILIDAPGWSHTVPAPARAPSEADRFAEAIHRAVAVLRE
jgi:hypothetical protein